MRLRLGGDALPLFFVFGIFLGIAPFLAPWMGILTLYMLFVAPGIAMAMQRDHTGLVQAVAIWVGFGVGLVSAGGIAALANWVLHRGEPDGPFGLVPFSAGPEVPA